METPSLSVSQAISLCNSLLSDLSFHIEGEVANFSISRGKFVFFDLKDEQQEARLGCFMMAYQLSSPLEDGMRVVLDGKPSLYQKSGQFRITVTRVTPKGEGSVKRAFELLVRKLQEEGLFAKERKRLLPRYVTRVGIISSADAAGFGDFKKIAFQRLQGVEFILINVAVQGNDAEPEICQAFDYLNSYFSLDAIALLRGGGSMEDLQAFNSEQVARAITRSKAPVLVGVGHERDITIADYCADIRASTPSNAAQLLLPEESQVREYVVRLTQDGKRKVEQTIHSRRDKTITTCQYTARAVQFNVQQTKMVVQNLVKTINAISPQATLQRGYSVTQAADGTIITSVNQVTPTAAIITHVSDGKIISVTT